MTAGKYVLWFLLCSAAYALVFLIQIPLRRKGRYVLRIVLCIIKGLLATAVAYLIMVVTSWFSMRGVYPTSALYVALCGDVISDLIMIPVSILRKDKLRVLRLTRISEGPLTLGDLKPGRWRDLTKEELQTLKESIGYGDKES